MRGWQDGGGLGSVEYGIKKKENGGGNLGQLTGCRSTCRKQRKLRYQTTKDRVKEKKRRFFQ